VIQEGNVPGLGPKQLFYHVIGAGQFNDQVQVLDGIEVIVVGGGKNTQFPGIDEARSMRVFT